MASKLQVDRQTDRQTDSETERSTPFHDFAAAITQANKFHGFRSAANWLQPFDDKLNHVSTARIYYAPKRQMPVRAGPGASRETF